MTRLIHEPVFLRPSVHRCPTHSNLLASPVMARGSVPVPLSPAARALARTAPRPPATAAGVCGEEMRGHPAGGVPRGHRIISRDYAKSACPRNAAGHKGYVHSRRDSRALIQEHRARTLGPGGETAAPRYALPPGCPAARPSPAAGFPSLLTQDRAPFARLRLRRSPAGRGARLRRPIPADTPRRPRRTRRL